MAEMKKRRWPAARRVPPMMIRGAAAALLLLSTSACDRLGKSEDPSLLRYDELKVQIQAQADEIELMKVAGTVHEGDLGFLLNEDQLPLDHRRLVQQENVWREQIFEILAQHSGHSKEQVAGTFAELARQHGAEPKKSQ